ncbi:MAG: hypothetical protein DRO12_01170, partial [Thermoprotei archaeon]
MKLREELRKTLDEFRNTIPIDEFLDPALYKRGNAIWLGGEDSVKVRSRSITELINELMVLPSEVDFVLHRLRRGELKQFCDSFVEANTCSYLESLCREEGPRIYYMINAKPRLFVELYSECIELDLLIFLLLGDLARFTLIEKGWRGGIPYTRLGVPRIFLEPSFIRILTSVLEQRRTEYSKYSSRPVKIRNLSALEDYIVKNVGRISEIILAVPCPTDRSAQLVSTVLGIDRDSFPKVIVVRPPSEAEVICCETYDRLLSGYLKLVETAEEMGAYVCTSDVVDTHIIINRSTVITISLGNLLRRESIVAIEDRDYAERCAQAHYRSCICTNNLVKGV